MTSPIQAGRAVDAVQLPARSAAGTRFEQAVTQVARIGGPLSPALTQARDPNAGVRLMESVNEAKNRLSRLQRQMQHTSDISMAPLVAQQMQELDYQTTVAAKTLGKIGSTIKEIATAA
ncbi:MAG: hypothetical protein EOP37_08970 [Rubrivivax sp.]|nr:MAG: hypothetical protein EOP37_08970 [Rubrivivax sp.]